ncbi:MAG: hypothetical protein GYB68_12950 [Chloroflexi bacterium]|nr:hypothetical protein [Chloroflexota bacterium]
MAYDIEKVRAQRQQELNQIRQSPRASHVYIVMPDPPTPLCRKIQGTFPKDSDRIPELPHPACPNPRGCLCRYEPFVDEVGP